MEKIVKHDSWPIQPDTLNPPFLRLTSRKPCGWTCNQLTNKVDGGITGSRLRWSTLSPSVRHHNPATGFKFDLPRQQRSLLNRFRTEQGHCVACRRKRRLADTDLCPCGETQTMSHIVESCPLTKLNGGLSRLHSADEDAVSWLTYYGSRHAYEKKKLALIQWSLQ